MLKDPWIEQKVVKLEVRGLQKPDPMEQNQDPCCVLRGLGDAFREGWSGRSPVVYFASHGEGFHREASGIFLKCVLVKKGWNRYCGSVTIVVTTSH
jgi:hypothetical protein